MRRWICLIIALSAVLPLAGQQTLRVDIRLVNVFTTVTDATGKYVAGLTRDDFVLAEDGIPQEISHFSQDDEIPVSVGVLFDSSGSMQNKLRTAVTAVDRFVRTIHRDDDIFLMSFASRTDLKQDFTDNRDKLTRALRSIQPVGGTNLYDALELALQKIRTGRHPKRAILLISDGDDTGSKVTFAKIRQDVRESELLVYPLAISATTYGDPADHVPFTWPPPMPGSRNGPIARRRDAVDMKVMQSLADDSGGRAFLLQESLLGNTSQIDKILNQVADELRSQYTLAFYPTHPDDGKFHTLSVTTKSGLRARTRPGYTAK